MCFSYVFLKASQVFLPVLWDMPLQLVNLPCCLPLFKQDTILMFHFDFKVSFIQSQNNKK